MRGQVRCLVCCAHLPAVPAVHICLHICALTVVVGVPSAEEVPASRMQGSQGVSLHGCSARQLHCTVPGWVGRGSAGRLGWAQMRCMCSYFNHKKLHSMCAPCLVKEALTVRAQQGAGGRSTCQLEGCHPWQHAAHRSTNVALSQPGWNQVVSLKERGAHKATLAHPSPCVHLSHDACRVVSLRMGRRGKRAACVSGRQLSSNSDWCTSTSAS